MKGERGPFRKLIQDDEDTGVTPHGVKHTADYVLTPCS